MRTLLPSYTSLIFEVISDETLGSYLPPIAGRSGGEQTQWTALRPTSSRVCSVPLGGFPARNQESYRNLRDLAGI